MEKDINYLDEAISEAAIALKGIKLKRNLAETPLVLLTGEIFVRNDGISRQYIVEKLAEEGIACKTSGLIEWVHYTDWCCKRSLSNSSPDCLKRLALFYRSRMIRKYERKIKKIWSDCGLIHYKLDDVKHILHSVSHLISPELKGEAILTIGSAMTEILDPFCGVIAIGPFGCMPNRISESILSREMNSRGKRETGTAGLRLKKLLDSHDELPFLCIESDGNPFPQLITAKLETFILQARRFHGELSGLSG